MTESTEALVRIAELIAPYVGNALADQIEGVLAQAGVGSRAGGEGVEVVAHTEIRKARREIAKGVVITPGTDEAGVILRARDLLVREGDDFWFANTLRALAARLEEAK